jgi:hypothetical protein
MGGRNSFIHNIRSLGHFDSVHSGPDGRTFSFLAHATSSLVPNHESNFYYTIITLFTGWNFKANFIQGKGMHFYRFHSKIYWIQPHKQLKNKFIYFIK